MRSLLRPRLLIFFSYSSAYFELSTLPSRKEKKKMKIVLRFPSQWCVRNEFDKAPILPWGKTFSFGARVISFGLKMSITEMKGFIVPNPKQWRILFYHKDVGLVWKSIRGVKYWFLPTQNVPWNQPCYRTHYCVWRMLKKNSTWTVMTWLLNAIGGIKIQPELSWHCVSIANVEGIRINIHYVYGSWPDVWYMYTCRRVYSSLVNAIGWGRTSDRR